MFTKIQQMALLSAILLQAASAGIVVQRAATNICGIKGYDQGKGNYYYSTSSKINTYAACSAKCAADSTCKSFGFGDACMLFNIPLSGNFDADTKSKDTYYDTGCLSSATTSVASSRLSSSPTSAATTKTTTLSVAPTSSTTSKAITSTASSSTSSVTSRTSATSTTSAISKASISSATSTTSTTSTTSKVTVPSGCPAPASIQLTTLNWFNSTHNLDCPNPNFPADAQVCFDSTHNCVDAADGVPGGPTVCSCVPYCYTGLPSYAYQPFGYGPPDTLTISLDDAAQTSCSAQVSTGFRDFEIGSGHVNCGNAADTVEFYGDSNKDSGNNGTVNYNGYVYGSNAACKGTPRYSGSFPLSCTRDAGGNATCGIKNGKATLTLLSFQ